MIRSLPPERRETIAQMMRYGVTGGLVTLGVAGGYWLLAEPGGMEPMLAFTLVFLLFSVVSYVVHSRVTFRGHGARDRAHVRSARFLGVNMAGYVLNQVFVWLLVKQLDGPTWWPMIGFVFVTPLVTFALHRRWVFS